MTGLSGLFVLEVANTLGAAFAVSLLADYGATAVVCEPPEGSAIRRLGPKSLDETRWKILARNKRSVAADWNSPENEPRIRRLLLRADMLVVDTAEPARAGDPWFAVLETLPEADRPLVVAVFPTGADHPELWPYAIRPEFAAAASGVMALTGHTGQTPIQAEAPLTDYLAGTLAAAKALLALRDARLAHAPPGAVSTPLHQAVQRMIEWQTPVATAKGRPETRMANNFPMNAGIANMHPTGDGRYVAISAVTQATADRLMHMVGGPGLAADPRFATAEARMRGLGELYAKIDAWTAARTTDEIMDTAAAQDVVVGPVYTTDDIRADPQIAARGNIVEVADNEGRAVAMPSVTPRWSGFDPVIRNLGPSVGQHNSAALPLDGEEPAPELTRGLGAGGANDPSSRKPLRVIELGAVIAGPFAGSLLADLGCEVIKVETPGAGDSLRKMGRAKDGIPLWFATSARDKECVTINLKHPAGQAMFKQLVAGADVLIENFRPGVLERLGLDWDALRAVNPRLVVLSISGFGQTGPQKSRPGFGKIAEGLSGVVNLTGEAQRSPLFVGFSLADASAGLFGVFGAAAALYRRDVLGGEAEGGRIDLALYEPLMRMLDCQLALHAATGTPPARNGRNDPYSFGLVAPDRPRFRCVESRSGDWYFLALAAEDVADRLIRLDAKALSNAELEASLTAMGIAFAPVCDGLSMANTPYFQARGDVVSVEHPVLGRIAAPGRLNAGRTAPVIRSPGLGADNRSVFTRMLGLDEAELDRLAALGVI